MFPGSGPTFLPLRSMKELRQGPEPLPVSCQNRNSFYWLNHPQDWQAIPPLFKRIHCGPRFGMPILRPLKRMISHLVTLSQVFPVLPSMTSSIQSLIRWIIHPPRFRMLIFSFHHPFSLFNPFHPGHLVNLFMVFRLFLVSHFHRLFHPFNQPHLVHPLHPLHPVNFIPDRTAFQFR